MCKSRDKESIRARKKDIDEMHKSSVRRRELSCFFAYRIFYGLAPKYPSVAHSVPHEISYLILTPCHTHKIIEQIPLEDIIKCLFIAHPPHTHTLITLHNSRQTTPR